MKQKKEITRSGIIPPPRNIIVLNRKQVLEAKKAALEAKPKKEFKIIDAEELFDRLKEKHVQPTTTSTDGLESGVESEYELKNLDDGRDIIEETRAHSIVSALATLAPAIKDENSGVNTESVEQGEHTSAPAALKTEDTSDEKGITNLETKINVSKTAPRPTPKDRTATPLVGAQNSLGDVLAALPKEKLEKFKQYLLTLNKRDKKLISNTLKKNFKAALKLPTTTANPKVEIDNDAVIDLGILGSFHLEKPRRTIFEDELLDNEIRTERPIPVFKPQ